MDQQLRIPHNIGLANGGGKPAQFAMGEDADVSRIPIAVQFYSVHEDCVDIAEQESYAFPPLECVNRCLRNLERMGRW